MTCQFVSEFNHVNLFLQTRALRVEPEIDDIIDNATLAALQFPVSQDQTEAASRWPISYGFMLSDRASRIAMYFCAWSLDTQ